jgi:hypothetical protein
MPARFACAPTPLVPHCLTTPITALLSLSPSLEQAHVVAEEATAFTTTVMPPRLR